MSYTTEYKRRRRVAESLGITKTKIKGSHIEHAAAQESRDVNAQVLAGTYVPSPSKRFQPYPQLMHFSPHNLNDIPSGLDAIFQSSYP